MQQQEGAVSGSLWAGGLVLMLSAGMTVTV